MSTQIDHFVTAVETFTNWVNGEPDEKELEAVKALQSLSSLYTGAIQLMAVDTNREEPESEEDYSVSVDEWNDAYERLSSMPFTYYKEVESPHESESEESLYTDILEDLTDIYQDILEGLKIYNSGLRSQAVSHWQMTFEFHWGRHVLGAMKALHCYFQEERDFAKFA
ncbi:MAG: DUF5063 domain-containing protein [Lentisphaeraceae bacterium]|nr:DUF5063 domain-containing protein [Lentisphaeraceae bacterium]